MQKCQNENRRKQLVCPEFKEKAVMCGVIRIKAPFYKEGRTPTHAATSKRGNDNASTGSI